MIYAHKTTFVRAVDGDTVLMLIDQGMRNYRRDIIRLSRVDCCELKDKDPVKKARAVAAMKFSTAFFTPGKPCVVETLYQDRTDPWGRWVGEVWCDGKNLSDALLAAGLAVPYPKA